MAKVTISPLLRSMFNRTSRITKSEAENLVNALSVVGDDTVKISLAKSIDNLKGKRPYLIIKYQKSYGSLPDDAEKVLETNGWICREFLDRGNDGYWIFFESQV